MVWSPCSVYVSNGYHIARSGHRLFAPIGANLNPMRNFFKQSGGIFYRAGDHLVDNDGIEFAGYLTFLSLLALFPFLVLIVATAGFIGQG
jgi:hypothetical protein